VEALATSNERKPKKNQKGQKEQVGDGIAVRRI
jgi:hypothetical protein